MALLTISGGMGCGADKVARFVADKTKVPLYDDQKLQVEAIKLGLRSQELKGFDEKAPGFLIPSEDTIPSFTSTSWSP